jgi:predicted transcriptional regulator
MLRHMPTDIPTCAELRAKLLTLTWSQVQELSRTTGAPFTTVWKIRDGETVDPRLETVRLIWPHVANLKAPKRTRNAVGG